MGRRHTLGEDCGNKLMGLSLFYVNWFSMLPDVRQYFWLIIFGKRILAMATLPPFLPIYFLTKRHRAKTKLRKTECLYSWESSVIYFCSFHKCIISLVFFTTLHFYFQNWKKKRSQPKDTKKPKSSQSAITWKVFGWEVNTHWKSWFLPNSQSIKFPR